ncbi:Thioredoxin-like fold-containing protein [Gemmatirosa kalamazoonensis]|uniref:Thioredoxin-like fold-containing protein n=1 Tax=Gemmatirosa kalamazoonensis TaxID=861299 RepID=W0RF54_9BACT|nr:thioredoxin fold domain-containing protein [Gemmatirosa kalamazoonensis]AHG88970.1 Thioredoxin-like fold-containing protein [Gemmatirosa kalamazoonensis]
MTTPRLRSRLSPAGAALLAAIVGVGAWLGARTPGAAADRAADAAAARAATLAGGAEAGLVAFRARTLDGTVLPLAKVAEPTVVMVSSETCQYCKAALREMGRVAAGRPLHGLRLVTLEGAAAGVPMVQAANVDGATLAGPVSPSAESMLALQIRGTPTFVALDARGRVTGTLVGYPGAEAFRGWVGVMLGERGRPE